MAFVVQVLFLNTDWQEQFIFSWLSFSVTILLLDWLTFFTIHPQEIRKNAKLQDSSRLIIFLFIIVACLISLFTVIVLVIGAKEKHGAELIEHVLLTVASVTSSWFLVHTIFTLRYAHMYYLMRRKVASTDATTSKYVGGLTFPDECEPDYLDFCYFAFGIATTFQVSDIEVTSSKIRRLVLIHGLLSFAFNTVIVALSINILSGLVGK